ncbi:MAG: hypothetical protein WBC13_03855 [Dokdonella sp.]|jgi:hypothetical protein|uniref:hypothetical protein n=1 Tax=Dokdonella sp. TaxID=2291710 RepID=UPI0025BE9C5E|nr:hypothetical protein [Dokdonella sp.]MBK8123103.1 hypothetical protein [Dokdonella sp.]HNV08508.1 hypothetical protein [Dokdonella sp.]HPW03440.1 hypothetical protein [Dokdonella sp.]
MSKLIRVAVLAVLCQVTVSGQALAGNLVFHQGFETCWVDAIAKATFLQSMESSIDGTTACIPSQAGVEQGVGYTVCAIPNGCGAGVDGCPVVLAAGAFSGNFQAGQFTAPGTTNNLAIPLTTTVFGACSINLTNVVLAYDLDYLMQVDGTDGVHTEDMQTPTVDIVSYSTADDCNPVLDGFIASYLPQAIAGAETAAAQAIDPGLRADTLEQSICPLSSP